ncbi:uncharacterized protein [Euphorbia lathyris]|uniref:uncharacterized protein n=1 Tax=Euphorbia lathyris TaxID=212925 RepID=UPI0033137DA5
MSEMRHGRQRLTSSSDVPPPPEEAPEQVPAQIEASARIHRALNNLFFFRNSRSFINWFGFFESMSFSILHLIFTTILLIGVMVLFMKFDIYAEFSLLYIGPPFLFLYLSNIVSTLTFALTGNPDDKLWSLLLLNDRNTPDVEMIDEHILDFSKHFSSKMLNFRVFVACFTLISVVSRVAVDLQRLNQHASPFYCGCITVFWCYLCIDFVISNGFIYIAAESCKIHVSIYMKFLNRSGNNLAPLLEHHKRLIKVVENLSKKYSWYLASQNMICYMSAFFTLTSVRAADIHRTGPLFMLGAPDFMCLVMVELPVVWTILLVLKDLTLQIDKISAIVSEKSKLALVSWHPRIASDWINFARDITRNTKGVYIYTRKVNSGLLLCFGMQTFGVMVLGILISKSLPL